MWQAILTTGGRETLMTKMQGVGTRQRLIQPFLAQTMTCYASGWSAAGVRKKKKTKAIFFLYLRHCVVTTDHRLLTWVYVFSKSGLHQNVHTPSSYWVMHWISSTKTQCSLLTALGRRGGKEAPVEWSTDGLGPTFSTPIEWRNR